MNLAGANPRQSDIDSFNLLADAVKRAVAPFDPGVMVAWLEADSWMTPIIRVKTSGFPTHVFQLAIDPRFLAEPDAVAENIAEEVFRHFRNRPTLPVDDNVQLGEN